MPVRSRLQSSYQPPSSLLRHGAAGLADEAPEREGTCESRHPVVALGGTGSSRSAAFSVAVLCLTGADLSDEELTVTVVPKQADEFTCSRCFLVHHRNRLAHTRNSALMCRDCAD